MFVLMSKKATLARTSPPATTSAQHPSSRTQNACDACRIRKTKCDGHTPCGRCRAKDLVCTTSRRLTKASGPVTEEHVALLQEQQRSLTRAISNMIHVIRAAESRGFVVERDPAATSTLSPDELAQVLRNFAPDSPTDQTAPSSVGDDPTPSKKRRFQGDLLSAPQTENVQMHDVFAKQTDHGVAGDDAFQRFLMAIQQHSSSNKTGAIDTNSLSELPPAPSRMPSTATPQSMSINAPLASPAPQFDQLAPFMDMVDWDASLEQFLNSQYNESSPDWSVGDASFNCMNGTSDGGE